MGSCISSSERGNGGHSGLAVLLSRFSCTYFLLDEDAKVQIVLHRFPPSRVVAAASLVTSVKTINDRRPCSESFGKICFTGSHIRETMCALSSNCTGAASLAVWELLADCVYGRKKCRFFFVRSRLRSQSIH